MEVPNRCMTGSTYRYGFQGQEKDGEIKGEGNSVNFKYRMHDPRVGRFFAPDPLFRKYPHNSVYAFSENRVLDAVELEGREAFFIHGTTNILGVGFGSMEWNQRETPYALNNMRSVFGNKSINTNFKWSGNLSDSARHKAALELAVYVVNNRKKGEPITLVVHSHGGNVAIEAANILVETMGIPAEQINIVALNTPMQDDITLKFDKVNLFSVSARNDIVKQMGADTVSNDTDVKEADGGLMYDDQLDSSRDSGSNHIGGADENSKVWISKLKDVVKTVEKDRKKNEKNDSNKSDN